MTHLRSLCLLAATAVLVSSSWGKATASASAADSYNWDFLTGRFDNITLKPLGQGAVKLLRPASDGLHVRLPMGTQVNAVGFSPRFTLRGDFEVVLAYKIVDWNQPTSGRGVGPSLYLTVDEEGQPAAELNRLLLPDGRSVCTALVVKTTDGHRHADVRTFDSDTMSGRLRLRRTGPRLEFAAANGLAGDFQPLHEFDFTIGDVTLLRAVLKQSDATTPAEAVFTSFSAFSDALPHLPSAQARNEPLYMPRYHPPPPKVSYAWIWQTGLGLVIAAAAVVWFVRYRTR